MTGGSEIRNVLTLDVTKFTTAIDRATTDLESLTKHLKSAAKLAQEFDKDVAGAGGTVLAEKFNLIDQTVKKLASNLDKSLGVSLDTVATKTRKVKSEVDGLAAGTERAGKTLLSMSEWTRRYGTALESLKPSLQRTTDSQRELTKAQKETSDGAQKSAAEQIKARILTLENEKVANAKQIAEKQKLAAELAAIENKIRAEALGRKVAADQIAARVGVYGGKNKIAIEMAEAGRLENNANWVHQQAEAELRLARAIQEKNAATVTAIETLKQEHKAALEAEEARRAALQQSMIEAREERLAEEKAAKETARVKREEERMWRQYQKEQRKRATEDARTEARAAADAAKQAARDAKEAERQASEEKKAIARKELDEKRAIERQKRDAAKAAAREEADFNKWMKEEQKKWDREQAKVAKEAAAERVRAERDAAKAVQQAARDTAAAARQAAEERKRAAKDAADYERQQARDIANMWKGMAALWAASKIQHGLAVGVDKASEYQQAEMRVKLLNLPAAEFEEFKKKAFDITKEEKYISTIDAMQARLDALTAIGYNHKEAIDSTMQSALRNAQVMIASGYEAGSRSDLIKNLYGFAESRQVMNNPEKVIESFDIARRMGVASGGKINIADLETVARNMGDLRQTMSKDGWLGVAALMEQFKVAGSQGHGGAGAGVQAVGTMLKMMSLYAAGKPVTNQAAIQLLGADVMNDVYANGAAQQFKESAATNESFRRMVKTAGFKGVKEMSENPVDFFSGLRGQILDYTKSDKNKETFYHGGEMDSDRAESAALKQFFAKMGMSNKTVDGMLTMMNKAFIERSQHVRQLAKDAATEEQAMTKLKETWSNAVSEMTAGASSLGAAFAPFLEKLAVIPKFLGEIMRAASDFVKNNPIAGAFSAIAVAGGGVVLAIRGILGPLGALGLVTARGFSAATLLSGGMAGLRAATLATTLSFGAGGFAGVSGIVSGVSLAISSALKVIGGALLRAIPLVGAFVLAWDIAGIVGNLEVGGKKIKDWLGGWLDSLSEWWELSWLKMKRAVLSALTFDFSLAGAWKWITDSVASLIDWLKGAWKGAKEAALAAFDLGADFLSDAKTKLFEWGNAVIEWFKLKWKSVKEAVRDAFTFSASEELKKVDAQIAAIEAKHRTAPKTASAPKPAPTPAPKPAPKPSDPKVREVPDPFQKKQIDHNFENAFERSLAQLTGALDINTLKLNTTLTGNLSYNEQAMAAFKEKWLAGDFDDGKDPSKRPFVRDGMKYDPKRGWKMGDLDFENGIDKHGNSIDAWLKEWAAGKQLEDQMKAITFAKERAAASDEDAATAAERLTQETLGQTDAMKALNREFAREESRNPKSAADAQDTGSDYYQAKARALLNRARVDLDSYAADLTEKVKQMQASFTTDMMGMPISMKERVAKEFDAATEVEKRNYQMRLDMLREIMATYPVDADEYQKAVKEKELAEAAFTAWVRARAREREEATKSEAQKVADQWHNVIDSLEKAQADWMTRFEQGLEQLLDSGGANKFKNWADAAKSYIRSVLVDIRNMMLKDALAEPLKAVTGWIKDAIGGLFGKAGVGNMKKADGSALNPFYIRDADKATNSLLGTDGKKGFFDSVSDGLKTVWEKAKDIFGGIGDWMSSTFSSLISAITSSSVVSSAGSWLSSAASFIGSFFANGGIMTSAGPLNLKAYSTGGIANSPQLALFGEGRLPEAYVPLPDGRTIPVTVNGNSGSQKGGGNNVVISITVNGADGKESKSSSTDGADPARWNQLADRVKGVVREELVTQARPGGLLYK